MNNNLSFKVSTGLKNIIGRDLISDKYIAVFELVKNSYDANASKVIIEFINGKYGEEIIITDNGDGMDYNDIVQKWLFVAYSEKKDKNRLNNTYRGDIKRAVAGAKGVGRFSCDRLGERLKIITRTKCENHAHIINVNWNNFEFDDLREFMEVSVEYSVTQDFPNYFKNGTSLHISNLRENWDRSALLRLKQSLMKLISPDIDLGESPFDIEIIASNEIENDNKASGKKDFNADRDVVNGLIRNDIFEKLNIKTTNIQLEVSKDGEVISSTLLDRGQYIFTILEKNRDYRLLNDIHISVFYLNRSAKMNFTRQMGGVSPGNYGSVFIYKNGFRINPYGEPGYDFFNINQRKAQGYNRYLGTRELMGRISIRSNSDKFIETSSRAHGFISTSEVDMLISLFYEKVLKVLEKYVVNIISWGEPLKQEHDHVIEPNEVIDKIMTQFITVAKTSDIIKIEYNESLLNTIHEEKNASTIHSSLKKLETAAEESKDVGLINLAHDVKQRTEAILSHNIELENENAFKENELKRVYQQSSAREKQVYFLQGVSNQNVQNLINGYHTIYALTDAIKGNIDYLNEVLGERNFYNNPILQELLRDIIHANDKAHKLSDLAIHGSQSLKQDGKNSINDFIRQYIDSGMVVKGLKYNLISEDKAYKCKFDSASIGIIIDNVSSNSLKAGATELCIYISESAQYVELSFVDNGIGLSNTIEPNMLFEWGISANSKNEGFGIGLYHIKSLLDELHGTVRIDSEIKNGFKLVVALRK